MLCTTRTQALLPSFRDERRDRGVCQNYLVDKVLWHKVFVDQEERKNKSDTPLKFGVLANRIRKQYTEAKIKVPTLHTVKNIMKCVLALSPRAIEALRDITHLPGRDEND
ncbi:unnamed protein product, partial [Ascophyllum nodosum]